MITEITHILFEEAATKYPNNIAIESPGNSYSYKELNERSERLADTLKSINPKKEQVVYVAMYPSEKLVRTLLSVFKSGLIYLPIDLGFSKKRLMDIFSQNNSNCIITDADTKRDLERMLKELKIQLPFLIVLNGETEIDIFEYSENGYVPYFLELNNVDHSVSVDAIDGNYIIYTSGSTGEAKAILGCHRGLTHFIRWEIKEFNLDNSCRVSMLSQHTFDASLRDVFVPLSVGGTLCIPERNIKANAIHLIGWLDQCRVTLIHCVPSLFRLVTKELGSLTATKLKELKFILMAGETLYARDIVFWRNAVGEHVELVNLYGTSETTLAKTFHRIKEIPANLTQSIHCGKPIDGAFVGIVNGKRLCRIGEIGEIFIKTSYMTKGYPHNKVLHEQVFIQNPLVTDEVDIVHKTGDLGRYLQDRSIEVLGRLDNQVKVAGVRVELGEIDRAVLSMDGIENAVTITHKNSDNQNELVCYYTGKKTSVDALREHLKEELNEGIVPTYLIKLDSFPLNLNGKIDKNSLPRPEHVISNTIDYKKPETDTEIRLEKIWCELLNLKQVGIIAHFFKIGGSSIKAMQMASRIFSEFNVTIKISDILIHPTIVDLAKIVEGLQSEIDFSIYALPKQDNYELSHAQKGIWIMCQLEKNHSNYNMTEALELIGDLNIPAFKDALQALVSRHEILRTNFKLIDHEPRQLVTAIDKFDFRISVLDYSDITDQDRVINDIVRKEFQESFDLESGPLIRSSLVKIAEDRHIFLFSIHHIISDGWSLEIILNELVDLYAGFCNGKGAKLTPLRIHYKDFAAWQNKQMVAKKMEELKSYWVKQFKGHITALDLATGKASIITNMMGDRVTAVLPRDVTSRIERFSEKNGVTLFMTLLASYFSLLFSYSRKKDIIVACPSTNRLHPDLENQVGIYLNTLAFRLMITEHDSFNDILRNVQQVTTQGFDHQLYPFDLLTKDLGFGGQGKRNPLSNIMFDMLEFGSVETKSTTITGIEVKPYFTLHNTNKSDLTMYATRSSGELRFNIGYDTSLFNRDWVERLLRRYLILIEAVMNKPTIRVSEITLNSDVEFLPLQRDLKIASISNN